jgi:hypothetical protein
LDILGTGTYLGSEGGLYPNGSNVRPAAHDAFGVGLANAIQPLDANGNPDPNGKYVLLGVGESDTRNIFNQFVLDASADPTKNSSLVIVDGAQGDGTAGSYVSLTSPYWNTIINYDLPNSGVTDKQVVAVWVQTVTENPTGTFPADVTELQGDLEIIAQNLLVKFPKWAIQDQLAGDPNLNFDPALGPVLAPWMSWGSYYWANGLRPATGGLVWTCQDLKDDGIHPSLPAGSEKAANTLLNFFKTDDTTAPWFLAP